MAEQNKTGGTIERGKVVSVSGDSYMIESLDREGITTPELIPIDNSVYIVGDYVYFFYFPDGTGRILCGF